jgi:4'-phosphopantetheinyl transferase
MAVQLRLTALADCAHATESMNWCSAAETRRALGIASPRRRAQFLSGRWLARQMLSEYFGGAASDWQMRCDSGYAPAVESGPACASVSLAHRFDALVCGVASTPIGVDVEIAGTRASTDPGGLAELMLSAAETGNYFQTAESERPTLLCALWVLKEAWTKSCGVPLELSMLQKISALPVGAGAANARLWTAGNLTLGLVCQDRDALADVVVSGLPPNAQSTHWLVGVH